MAITFIEVLLLTTDLILIIIVVYLLERLRKIKKNAKPAEEKQSPENTVPLEAKPDLSVVKIEQPEKAEIKPGDELTASASPANSEHAPRKDELEDRLLEELHAIPSEVKSETEALEPGTLKLEDELPGENPAGMEPEDAKPEKVRKPRKKRSKSKKTSGAGEAEQTLSGETKAAPGKKTGRRKKAAEQAGQMVETNVEAKPIQEIAKEENAEVPVGEKKPEELKDPKKDSLF